MNLFIIFLLCLVPLFFYYSCEYDLGFSFLIPRYFYFLVTPLNLHTFLSLMFLGMADYIICDSATKTSEKKFKSPGREETHSL